MLLSRHLLFQQKEIEIRRQFRDTINIQRQQYKEYKGQILAKTPKEEQRAIIKRLKEDQRRKLAMLGDQYEQSIAEMLQRQSLRLDESQVNTVGVFHEKTNKLTFHAQKYTNPQNDSNWCSCRSEV